MLRRMPAVLLQTLAGTLLLLAAALWPRPGEPVLLALPQGAAPLAFAVEGWRVLRLSAASPFALVALSPESGAPPVSALLAASGGLFALRAAPGGACPNALPGG
jgi:hypothetical protein